MTDSQRMARHDIRILFEIFGFSQAGDISCTGLMTPCWVRKHQVFEEAHQPQNYVQDRHTTYARYVDIIADPTSQKLVLNLPSKNLRFLVFQGTNPINNLRCGYARLRSSDRAGLDGSSLAIARKDFADTPIRHLQKGENCELRFPVSFTCAMH